MTGADQKRAWLIGWDVGGWNCDKNQNNRDAIVILDTNHEIVGSPWRGNLRECINGCLMSTDWIAALFDLCRFDDFQMYTSLAGFHHENLKAGARIVIRNNVIITDY